MLGPTAGIKREILGEDRPAVGFGDAWFGRRGVWGFGRWSGTARSRPGSSGGTGYLATGGHPGEKVRPQLLRDLILRYVIAFHVACTETVA